MTKTYEVEVPEPPDPYSLDEDGYRNALDWIRDANMGSWYVAECADMERDVVVTKVNLMRGCW